jgi:hypothetical protein
VKRESYFQFRRSMQISSADRQLPASQERICSEELRNVPGLFFFYKNCPCHSTVISLK